MLEPFALLKRFVNQPSGTFDTEDVTALAEMVAAEFEALGFSVEKIPGEKFGPKLVCTIGTGGKNLMLMGHMDTVFPRAVCVPWTEREDGTVLGSGTVDMKGGIAVMLCALEKALPQLDLTKVKLTAVLNPDEEVGSPESHDIILENAKKAFAALSFEPFGPDGRMTVARKGVTSVLVSCVGKPGHSGAEYTKCASAIQGLCAQITKLYTLRDDEKEISFNAGLISGGTAENVVAPTASCKCEFRYFDQSLQEPLMERIRQIVAEEPVPGVTTSVAFGASHPAVDVTPASQALFDKAKAIGAEQGRALYHEKTGGAGDISIAGLAGIPVLDGLGLCGAGMHTVQEYMNTDCVLPQIELAEKLIVKVCADA